MAKQPHRISFGLFTDELKQLINMSAKIFPVAYDYVVENINPNNYEWVRIIDGPHRKEIYHWEDGVFELIGADDKEVDFITDVINKPDSYPPEPHSHVELHEHPNKAVLDLITQLSLETWDTVVDKADILHTHDDLYYTESEVDTLLAGKADSVHSHDSTYQPIGDYALANHDHDGRYNTKSEITTLLNQKASLVHTHDYASPTHNHDTVYAVKATENSVEDHELRLSAIEGGYSEGHTHGNLTVLDLITQIGLNNWNSAYDHLSDLIAHITAEERALWNTVSDKAASNHSHDLVYSALGHAHDDKYYTESEINTKLSSKSDTSHTHTDKADKTYVDTELAKKADSTTVSGHTGNTTVHVTSGDKAIWNGKINITQGTVKPASGYWFEEVV